MPGSPEWAAWDLRTGAKVASIKPDGYGIVSDDDRTIVVLHDPQEGDGARPSRMTVQRDGKQDTFDIPASVESDSWRDLFLSANGRWIASRLKDKVAVWSTVDGKLLQEYEVGTTWVDGVLRLSDSGDPLLVNDRDGTVFVRGRWQAVRSDQDPDRDALIVPLAPNFHPQCGVIVCDRVVAEFGVVERKPRDERARGNVTRNFSPDGRFLTVYLAQKENGEGVDIIDVADGHVVIHLDDGHPQFTPDSRFIMVRDTAFGSFIKYDLATGRRVSTAFPNWYQDGFYMVLADGHVRYSESRQIDLALVRGFEVRAFDAEAARQFIAPPDR